MTATWPMKCGGIKTTSMCHVFTLPRSRHAYDKVCLLCYKIGNTLYPFLRIAELKVGDQASKIHEMLFKVLSSLTCNPDAKNPYSEAEKAGRPT